MAGDEAEEEGLEVFHQRPAPSLRSIVVLLLQAPGDGGAGIGFDQQDLFLGVDGDEIEIAVGKSEGVICAVPVQLAFCVYVPVMPEGCW